MAVQDMGTSDTSARGVHKASKTIAMRILAIPMLLSVSTKWCGGGYTRDRDLDVLAKVRAESILVRPGRGKD